MVIFYIVFPGGYYWKSVLEKKYIRYIKSFGYHGSCIHPKINSDKDAEAANILVGEVEFLDEALCAFVRLKNAVDLGDLTEVSLKTRFLFILLGPAEQSIQSYHEVYFVHKTKKLIMYSQR